MIIQKYKTVSITLTNSLVKLEINFDKSCKHTYSILFILTIHDRSGNELGSYNASRKLVFEEEGYEEAVEIREEVFIGSFKLLDFWGYSQSSPFAAPNPPSKM